MTRRLTARLEALEKRLAKAAIARGDLFKAIRSDAIQMAFSYKDLVEIERNSLKHGNGYIIYTDEEATRLVKCADEIVMRNYGMTLAELEKLPQEVLDTLPLPVFEMPRRNDPRDVPVQKIKAE